MSTASESLFPEEAAQSAADMAAWLAQPSLPGHFDELFGRPAAKVPVALSTGSPQEAEAAGSAEPTQLAPHWEAFFNSLGSDGFTSLDARLEDLQRRMQDNGVTYNVYADADGSARPWTVDLFPFIVPQADWKKIERGIAQRAWLLCRIMHDVYGAQTLLKSGMLPPALVTGSPGYVRAMRGVMPVGGLFLHIVAFDLARGPDGNWSVVSQRCQAPSGLGYLLENRMSVSGLFGEAFTQMKVQRIAGTYRALIDNLQRLSPAGKNAQMVLLTPGPFSETYFEHVYLARYLGVLLVEGSDLIVRDKQLFLKTLQGLEAVHVVIRRLDDPFLDPLEMRSDSTLGVPGLMQAVRAGNVMLANAPGAGFLESPAVLGFLPAICQELLGEKQLMSSLPTWWCGEEAARDEAWDCLSDGVIKPTYGAGKAGGSSGLLTDGEAIFGRILTGAAREAAWHAVEAAPDDVTVQAYVAPAQTPVWVDGRIAPRQMLLRVYAVADGEDSWRVLPGGLARIAGPGQRTVSMQRGGSSVDAWVLTDGAVDTTTMLPTQLTPEDLATRHRPVSSRTGENLYWLGRYTERAENTVRLARLVLEFLNGAENPSPRVLTTVHTLCVENGLINKAVPSPLQSRRLFERALVSALGDATNGTSVAFNLRSLQKSASALRERLSREHWELMVTAADDFSARLQAVSGEDYSAAHAQRALEQVGIHLAAITGAQVDRMTRDHGWRLLSIGRQIERLVVLGNALHEGFISNMLLEDAGFNFMLGVFDSTITYRAQFQRRREIAPLLDLLVLDTDNPRSLAWVAKTLSGALNKLPATRRTAATAEQNSTAAGMNMSMAMNQGMDMTMGMNMDLKIDPASGLAFVQTDLAEMVPQPASWPLAQLCERSASGHFPIIMQRLEQSQQLAFALSDEIGQRYFSHARAPSRSVGA